ncbi:MAG: hypothetical protein NC177_11890 [Ruminococcus flavefaciens]|nr:hypothetical protein [Ruminococcus flavefaciens]
MKKNILYKIYSAVFVGICLVPSVLMPFVKSDTSGEKRKLSEIPEIKNEDGSINFEYFDEFETYFSEHFAFRQQLVTLDGLLKSKLFGTSPNKDVIVGKDGWLYYGETINDFLNINSLSDRGINNIKNNLEIINDYCTENDVQFVFTIAPNKNSVYPEHMPSNYSPAGNANNYERLSALLDEDFPYCDMKEVILNTDASIPLYHKKDTHWNNLGAYAGHARLMEMLGKEKCPSGNWTVRNDRKGDLAEMIYPSAKANDTQAYSDYNFRYQYLGRFKSFDDMSIKTFCDGKNGSLLMFRDSYGEAILPFIAECFGQAEFTRTVPYRLDNIGNGGADNVILEIVERNIPNLQKYAPLMPAPVVNSLNFKNLEVCEDITVKYQENGNYMHIFGELGDGFFKSDSTEIYVTANGVTYRAFNAFEDKLLERDGETSDNGFSLYIPKDSGVSPENITVISISDDGTAVSSQ